MYILRTMLRKMRAFFPSSQTYLQIQLFISLCSWPFLAAWGIPLSPASLLGNLMFAPLLSLFLLVSSLLFFSELLSLPNRLLMYFLELITAFWHTILTLGNRSWLFTTAHPPFFLAVLLPGIAGAIMMYTPFSARQRITAFFVVYLCAGTIIPYVYSYSSTTLTLPYYNKKLTLIRSRRQTALIDPGIIGRRISAVQHIRYTLLPFLSTNGITHLDIVIIAKPSHMVFKALSALVESFPVHVIVMPSWHGTLTNRAWASWEQLLKKARRYDTDIRLCGAPLRSTCGIYHISVAHQKRLSRKNRFSYHELICSYAPQT